MPVRRPDWEVLPETFKGTIFLLSLVTMRVDDAGRDGCRAASWQTAFGLGFVSAVFDNIPLTALALKQGGYDWGFLAYAVGFGGSMIWFGSSAGVALSNQFPEAKSVVAWLRARLARRDRVRHRLFRAARSSLGWHPQTRRHGVRVRACRAPHFSAARGHRMSLPFS